MSPEADVSIGIPPKTDNEAVSDADTVAVLNPQPNPEKSSALAGKDGTENVMAGQKLSGNVSSSTAASPKCSANERVKQKNVGWTPDEEEMLKNGVERCSRSSGHNMQWKRILKLGADVFHPSRTPDNLKDKWRRMTRSLQVEAGKKRSRPPPEDSAAEQTSKKRDVG